MPQTNKFIKNPSNLYRSLVATSLIANGVFQFVAPVLAEGTAAGQSISNQATVTYEDPNTPNTTINAKSNIVVVTVAEVAGITVTGSGVNEASASNGGTPSDAVKVNDVVNFDFTVTNVGNDPTRFRVPDLARVTGPGKAGKLQYSIDGGTTWTDIPGTEYLSTPIPVGGSILVRVPVTVQSGAQSNDVINVTLGDTPGDAQNQRRDRNDGGDVYTVDATRPSGIDTNPKDGVDDEVEGDPVNGVREASATQKTTVGQSTKSYAFASVFKVRTGYDNSNTPTKINDDKLSYDLSFRVELTDPTGKQITPAPLTGTTIKGFAEPRILVSDAIPKDMELDAIPTPPPGWQVVYAENPADSTNANDATWQLLTPGTNLSGVTRIGFVNDPAIVKTVAPGTTVTGFKVPLKVKASVPDATTSLTVDIITQLFGQTLGSTNLVYDESGDQRPSNFGDDNSIPLGSNDTNNDGIPDSNPTVDRGYFATPGSTPVVDIDSGNNNSGRGFAGELNRYIIEISVANGIINGPDRAPDAIGPTNNNDDFTNKSSLVDNTAQPGSTIDPSPVGFTNTVKNNGTTANFISLLPTPPAPGDLPTNTTVTITYDSQSKTYTWNGTQFTIGGQPITNKADYITTTSKISAGESINYGVEVNLPGGTPLSTDIQKGFPVPITAFIDDATPGLGNDVNAEPRNITIDRVYTGFLRMVKESRVLPGNGSAVQGNDGTWSSDPKKPAPGNIIEYRIRYKNISEAQAGNKNVLLEADKVVIVEDGTTVASGGVNNWAIDNDKDGRIDTSNVVGTAKDSGASTIQFYSGQPASLSIDQTGTTATTDVSKYVNTVNGKVAPGEERTFTFQRKVN